MFLVKDNLNAEFSMSAMLFTKIDFNFTSCMRLAVMPMLCTDNCSYAHKREQPDHFMFVSFIRWKNESVTLAET